MPDRTPFKGGYHTPEFKLEELSEEQLFPSQKEVGSDNRPNSQTHNDDCEHNSEGDWPEAEPETVSLTPSRMRIHTSNLTTQE